jgi:hypothetical protein
MAARCMNCNGILTKTDTVCYCCGDAVPKWMKTSTIPRQKSKRHSFLSNAMFFSSLALTAYAFLAPNKPPLGLSLAASGALLLGKFILDWTERRGPDENKA